MPINVSIVEDDPDTRTSIVSLIEAEADVRCLRAYGSGEEAVRDMPRTPPDVALVDINLPGMSGIECVARLRTVLPELQMLMLTKYDESDLIFDSLREGAKGYILKKMLNGELIPAIRQILAGGSPMSMQIARKVVDHFHQLRHAASGVEELTPREHEILKLLSEGYFYKEIGESLGISMNTVKTHLHVIYGKLHVQSRTQATLKYLGKE